MENRGTVEQTLNAGEKYTIQPGYYSGGTITAGTKELDELGERVFEKLTYVDSCSRGSRGERTVTKSFTLKEGYYLCLCGSQNSHNTFSVSMSHNDKVVVEKQGLHGDWRFPDLYFVKFLEEAILTVTVTCNTDDAYPYAFFYTMN